MMDPPGSIDDPSVCNLPLSSVQKYLRDWPGPQAFLSERTKIAGFTAGYSISDSDAYGDVEYGVNRHSVRA